MNKMLWLLVLYVFSTYCSEQSPGTMSAVSSTDSMGLNHTTLKIGYLNFEATWQSYVGLQNNQADYQSEYKSCKSRFDVMYDRNSRLALKKDSKDVVLCPMVEVQVYNFLVDIIGTFDSQSRLLFSFAIDRCISKKSVQNIWTKLLDREIHRSNE